MRSYPFLLCGVLCIVTMQLSACGTYVPALTEGWEVAEVDDALVYRIKKNVFCELRKAAHKLGNGTTTVKGVQVQELPDDWGAQLTLTLQVDETGSLNPSAAYNTAFPTGTISLPVATQLSSQATRRDIYYSFYSARSLKVETDPPDTSCYDLQPDNSFTSIDRHGSSPLFGDLGIERWLAGALLTQNALPPSPLPAKLADKGDVLSYDVKFIVITSGTANPTLKLVNLSTGGGMPLLSLNRTRTQELLLTLGPTEKSNGAKVPSQAAQGVHLAGELYSAVGNGFRSAIQQ